MEEKVDRLQLLEGIHSQQDRCIYELTKTVIVCKGPLHGLATEHPSAELGKWTWVSSGNQEAIFN